MLTTHYTTDTARLVSDVRYGEVIGTGSQTRFESLVYPPFNQTNHLVFLNTTTPLESSDLMRYLFHLDCATQAVERVKRCKLKNEYCVDFVSL